MIKDYYSILGVSVDADIQEIKSSYRKLAKMWHPDICKEANAHEKFVEINEAYEILSDATLREEYDYLLKMQKNIGKDKAAGNAYYESKTNEERYDEYYNSYQSAKNDANRRSEEYAKYKYEDFIFKILEVIIGGGISAVSNIINNINKEKEAAELKQTKVNYLNKYADLGNGIKAEIKNNILYFRGTGIISREHINLVLFRNIDKVIIEGGISGIGEGAFSGCSSLKSINMPKSLSKIEDYVFMNCKSLQYVEIPTSVVTIGHSCFYNCENLADIDIKTSSAVSIGKYAFYNCKSLKKIVLPSSLKTIDEYAFNNCKQLYDVNLPVSIKSIGKGAFNNCSSLKTVTLPPIRVIEDDLFKSCGKLEAVNIPDTVTEIKFGAFKNCDLRDVYVPPSVKKIGYEAFQGCRNLNLVSFNFRKTKIGLDTFKHTPYVKENEKRKKTANRRYLFVVFFILYVLSLISRKLS